MNNYEFIPGYISILALVIILIYVVLFIKTTIELVTRRNKSLENWLYMLISAGVFLICIVYWGGHALFIDKPEFGGSTYTFPTEIWGYMIIPLTTLALVFLNRVKVTDKKIK